MCLFLCQAIKVYSVCLSDHVKKIKINTSRAPLSLECKGDIENTGWEPYISLWTIFDGFTGVTRQAVLPFKNPPVYRICTQWEIQLIPIPQSFTWLPTQNPTLMKLRIKYLTLGRQYMPHVSAKCSVWDPVSGQFSHCELTESLHIPFKYSCSPGSKYRDYLAVHSTVKTTKICSSQITIRGAISS